MYEIPFLLACAIGVPLVLCGLLLVWRDQKQSDKRVADVLAEEGLQPGLAVPQEALYALRDSHDDVVARPEAFFPCAWMRVGSVEVCIAVYRGVWWTNRAHNFTHLFAFVRDAGAGPAVAGGATVSRDRPLSYESRTVADGASKQWDVVEGPRARRRGVPDEAAIRAFVESIRARVAGREAAGRAGA